MAQSARLAGLTDELVQSIVQFDPQANKEAYRRAKEIAMRGLRAHQYARTNQFDVAASFAGLDEKFRIKNRDDLADALRLRLLKFHNVTSTSRFKPDFLALLLLLADRPLENSHVEALDLLRAPSPPPPLTWSDILHDDPYSDEEIWDDIDYAVESSGDEKTPKKREKPRVEPTTGNDVDDSYDPDTAVIQHSDNVVQALKSMQFWAPPEDGSFAKPIVTELQAIRETLFMLAGLRTGLYHTDIQQQTVRINTAISLSHNLTGTITHVLSEFSSVGQAILHMRQWVKKAAATMPLVQAFEAAVWTRLCHYDHYLGQLQRRYLVPSAPLTVSLLDLLAEVRSCSVPLLRLAQVVMDVEAKLLINPLIHLEVLYEQTILSQMTLEVCVFDYMSDIFFECLRVYLKPVRIWMETGELNPDDETFFIFVHDVGSDNSSLWHDRYVLRRDSADNLRIPTFLHPSAMRIFNTGKSVIFLEALGVRHLDMQSLACEPVLDRQTVCGIDKDVPLAPFSELFQTAFEAWIQSKYERPTNHLRSQILNASGLVAALHNLELLYLSKNGAMFEELANSIYKRMDSGRREWNDRYVLTEVAREVFSLVMSAADVERIVIRSSRVKNQATSTERLATISLDFTLPWPVQNIIQRSSLGVYQQLFTFLLQVHRVKYLLQNTRITYGRQSLHTHSRTALKLHHRLIWFVDVLRSYITETAIFVTTQDMMASMRKAEDIDAMSTVHARYTANLEQRTLLSEQMKPIHKAVLEILNLGVLLVKTIALTEINDRATEQATGHAPSQSKQGKKDDDFDAAADSDDAASGGKDVQRETGRAIPQPNSAATFQMIDRETLSLLAFVTAGFKNIGRAGAEPMWEQVAERLKWDVK